MAKTTTASLARLFKKIHPCNRKLYDQEYYGEFTATEYLYLVDVLGVRAGKGNVDWIRNEKEKGEGGLHCFTFIPHKSLREHPLWKEHLIPR